MSRLRSLSEDLLVILIPTRAYSILDYTFIGGRSCWSGCASEFLPSHLSGGTRKELLIHLVRPQKHPPHPVRWTTRYCMLCIVYCTLYGYHRHRIFGKPVRADGDLQLTG